MKYFFKYHFPSKHYALIVSEQNNCYSYLSLTHVAKTARQKNILLNNNPNNNHSEPAFLNKHVRTNPTTNFSKKEAKHLQLSPEDELLVTNFLKAKNKSNEPERER